MSSVKIQIESVQDFGMHKDENISEYDATIKYFEDGVEVLYDGCKVTVKENTLFIDGENRNIKIVKDEATRSTMDTPFGKIDMSFNYIKLQYTKEPFLIYAKYEIALGETQKYTNEIKITIKQD